MAKRYTFGSIFIAIGGLDLLASLFIIVFLFVPDNIGINIVRMIIDALLILWGVSLIRCVFR